MMGFLVLPVWGLAELAERKQRQRLFFAIAAVATLLFALLTRQQVTYWHDSIALFSHALKVAQDSVVAHSNLGRAYDEAGRPREALDQYYAALALNPADAVDHYNVAAHLQDDNESVKALEEYEAVLRLSTDPALLARAHNNLGSIKAGLGSLDQASTEYEAAMRLQPQEPLPYMNLAALLERQGKIAQAIEIYRQAVQNAPTAAAYFYLGRDLEATQKPTEAAEAYQRALALAPDLDDAKKRLIALQNVKERK